MLLFLHEPELTVVSLLFDYIARQHGRQPERYYQCGPKWQSRIVLFNMTAREDCFREWPNQVPDFSIASDDRWFTMKIVIVDDNADAAIMLSMLFEIEGHSVVLAFSGRAGIDLITAAQPDIAIVDLSMPDIEGLEVVRAARKAPAMSQCVFLVLTGRTDLDARQIATEVGVAHFFTKGDDVSHLLSYIHQLGSTGDATENLHSLGSPVENNPSLPR